MSTIRDEKHRRLDELSVRASRAFVDSGLHGSAAEVVLALDVSDAMAPLYANGFIGELTTALLALAMKFDDNEQIPVWTFGGEAAHVGEIRKQDHRGWVDRHVRSAGGPMRLGPLIDALGRRYFPVEWDAPTSSRKVGDKLKRTVDYTAVREPRACPLFVIVVTAGGCDDALEAMRLLRKASHLPVFWQFTSCAENGQRFLKELDTLAETWVDACGFFVPEVASPPVMPTTSGLVRRPRFSLDEERLYRGLLNELPAWLDHERVKAMLQAPVAGEVPADELEAFLTALPAKEQERRERERIEREARRLQRAAEAELEVAQAQAWPQIRAEAEQEDEAPKSKREGRRLVSDTRPYQPEDGPAPVQDEAIDDEATVETAAERLLRIRARRNARKTGPG